MDAREHEERGHSARYLILLFLVCVATCGVFFSLGYLVGNNERSSRSALSTEVVTTPSVIPPNINPPAESVQSSPQTPASTQKPLNPPPDTLADSPASTAAQATAPAAKPSESPAQDGHAGGVPEPAPNPPPPSAASAGEVGEGITLQVVASRSQQDAEHIVDILKQKGYPVFLATPEYTGANDKFFRVLVGPFRTREEADRARDELVKEGFKSPFIRH